MAIRYERRLWRPETEPEFGDFSMDDIAVPTGFTDHLPTIHRNDEGYLVFGQRMTATVRTWVLRSVPGRPESDRFMEVRTDQAGVATNATLLAAAYPYSVGWTDEAPFKRHNKVGNDIWDGFDDVDVQEAGLVSYIQRLKRDPFEGNSRYLTARLSDPKYDAPEAWLGRQAMTRAPAEEVFAEDDGAKPGLDYVCLGVVQDADACVDALMLDPIVLRALSATDEFLFARYFGGSEALKEFKRPYPLHESLWEKADSTMRLAARRALCGPVKSVRFFRGDRVASLTVQIYLEALYNWNRRVRRAVKAAHRLVEVAHEEEAASPPDELLATVRAYVNSGDVGCEALESLSERAVQDVRSGDIGDQLRGCRIAHVLFERGREVSELRDALVSALHALEDAATATDVRAAASEALDVAENSG